MSVDKLLAGDNETVLLIPATEINGVPYLLGAGTKASLAAPTSTILNYWLSVQAPNSTNAGAGGNVSAALKDDLKLSLTDSSTDKDRTITSIGLSEALTFFNFVADFTIMRDQNLASATSAFNLANDLVRAPDIPYIIAHRIGKEYTVATAIGDEWDFYYAWTDNAVPVYTDGGNQQTKQTFIPKNLVNISFVLSA